MATDPALRPIPARRDFALLDLLILVAALAAALALARPDLDARPIVLPPNSVVHTMLNRTWLGRAYDRAGVGFRVGSAVASMLMLGLLVVSLRPPRHGLRRLSRRPGFAACVAAASAMAVNALEVGTMALFRAGPPEGVFKPFEPIFQARVGPAVLAAWLFLRLGGRWRPEKGMIDRTGRLLGLFWLAEMTWPWLDRLAISRLPASWWTR